MDFAHLDVEDITLFIHNLIFFKEEWLRTETENLINTKLHKDAEYFDAFLYDRENFRKQI